MGIGAVSGEVVPRRNPVTCLSVARTSPAQGVPGQMAQVAGSVRLLQDSQVCFPWVAS